LTKAASLSNDADHETLLRRSTQKDRAGCTRRNAQVLSLLRLWQIFMQVKVFNDYHQDDGVTPAPGAQDVYVNLDQWDGYQYKRQQIISALKQADVDNFVAITGDLHSFTAGYLYENFDSLNNAPEPAPDPPSAPGWSTRPECASWPAP
jgi:hypothetical protein